MATQDTVDLDQLGDRYEVIGELAGREDARTLIATERETGKDVLISVARTPHGDQGNALSHLASDAKLLSGRHHRSIVPVIDARWIGTETLAVVTERVFHPTLAELLVRREEAFSCPRIATLLQEINGALDWARGQKIVHRAVSLDAVYVEPGSDRVLVSFAARPLPRADMPGAEEDARTIARLARAMLTRSVADPERDRLPLADVRPGLPERLVEQTERLLALEPNGPVPDVREFIAVVAMADTLKRSELECAETTRKLLEEERIAQERLLAERQATERAAAEQARLFDHEREEFGRERHRILAELEKEGQALARERAALARERSEHEQDRATLLSEREEHRRWADEVEKAFAAQMAAFQRQVETQRAEFQRQVETQRAAEELSAPAPDGAPLALPPRPRTRRVTPEWARRAARVWRRRPHWNRSWNVPVAAAALILLIGLTTFALAKGGGGNVSATAIAARGTVVDSAAGATTKRPEAGQSTVPGIPADFVASVRNSRALGVPPDLVTGVRARADSGAAAVPALQPVSNRGTTGISPQPRQPGFQPSSAPASQRPMTGRTLPRPPAVRVETIYTDPRTGLPIVPPRGQTLRPDSLTRRDSLPRARPDTIPQPSGAQL